MINDNLGRMGLSPMPFFATVALRRRGWLLLLVTLFFWLDRLVKWMVQHRLAEGASWPVLPNVFHITHVQNTGIAFSLFNQYPAMLLPVTAALFAGFLVYSLSRNPLPGRAIFPLGLLLGGALGNLCDRLMLGYVVDYLDVVAIHYPIFNLADVFIFCGVGLLLLQYWPGRTQPLD